MKLNRQMMMAESNGRISLYFLIGLACIFCALALGLWPNGAKAQEDCNPGCGVACIEPEPLPLPAEPDLSRYGPVVYIEQPRSIASAGIYGDDFANWDTSWDIARLNGGMNPTLLVVDDLKGTFFSRKVIKDCTTDDSKICFVEDPKIRPDGKKIVYSECQGDRIKQVGMFGIPWREHTAPEINNLTSCHLWEYDIASNTSTQITFGDDVRDRTPDYFDNETLVWASDREKSYGEWTHIVEHRYLSDPDVFIDGDEVSVKGRRYALTDPRITIEYGKVFVNDPEKNFQFYNGQYTYHIFKGKIGSEGRIWRSGMENLTPEQCLALSPEPRTDGIIMFTSAKVCGGRAILTTSPRNKTYIAEMDFWGRNTGKSFYGNHHTPNLQGKTTGISQEPKVLRPAVEIKKGVVAIINYYRGNHSAGVGDAIGVMVNAFAEGVRRAFDVIGSAWPRSKEDGTGRFTPASAHMLFEPSQSRDEKVLMTCYDPAEPDKKKACGKIGGPAPHPQAEFMFTWCRGSCTVLTKTHPDPTAYNTREALGGEPTAQQTIALALVPIITNPHDPAQVLSLPQPDNVHRRNAQVIRTYQENFGQPVPNKPEPYWKDPTIPEGWARLNVVDVREFESPRAPGHEAKYYRQAYIGNVEDEFAENVAQFGFKTWAPWKTPPNRRGLLWGKVYLEDINSDGSVSLLVPAETPGKMFAQGIVDRVSQDLALDMTDHSMRNRETRTCWGCHDGHSVDREKELRTKFGSKEEAFDKTIAGQLLAKQRAELLQTKSN